MTSKPSVIVCIVLEDYFKTISFLLSLFANESSDVERSGLYVEKLENLKLPGN